MASSGKTLRSVGRGFVIALAGVAVLEAGLIVIWARGRSAGSSAVASALTRSWTPGNALSKSCSPAQVVEAERVQRERRVQEFAFRSASKRARTDPNGLELWDTPRGSYWIPPGDSRSLFQVLAEQTSGIYSVPEAAIQPGDVVLDVGASFGGFTREALAKGAAKVVAIDPAPPVIECLRRNFAEEIASGKVVVVAKGAWDEEDTLEMTFSEEFTLGARVLERGAPGASANAVRVPLTTIDAMVAELRLERVDFIKMDIEGAEPRALRGSLETLRRFRPRLALCVYHRDNHPVLLPNLVRSAVPDYRQRTVCIPTPAIEPEISFFW